MASMTNTSSSGRLNLTTPFHLRPRVSTQSSPTSLTIRPTSGCGLPKESVLGSGNPPGALVPSGKVVPYQLVNGLPLGTKCPSGPPSGTAASCTVVVLFPDKKAAA